MNRILLLSSYYTISLLSTAYAAEPMLGKSVGMSSKEFRNIYQNLNLVTHYMRFDQDSDFLLQQVGCNRETIKLDGWKYIVQHAERFIHAQVINRDELRSNIDKASVLIKFFNINPEYDSNISSISDEARKELLTQFDNICQKAITFITMTDFFCAHNTSKSEILNVNKSKKSKKKHRKQKQSNARHKTPYKQAHLAFKIIHDMNASIISQYCTPQIDRVRIMHTLENKKREAIAFLERTEYLALFSCSNISQPSAHTIKDIPLAADLHNSFEFTPLSIISHVNNASQTLRPQPSPRNRSNSTYESDESFKSSSAIYQATTQQ